MEDDDRGLIFGGVRYTIIPSDELDHEKTRLVRRLSIHLLHRHALIDL
jgi:hypothetical protein